MSASSGNEDCEFECEGEIRPGKKRERRGFMVVKQAQTIAMFTSHEFQLAISAASQVISCAAEFIPRARMAARAKEMMHTLYIHVHD